MGVRRSRRATQTTTPPRLVARHTTTTPTDTWYRIRNRAGGGTAVVDIYGEIGFYGATAADLVYALRQLDVDTIELNLNSPGGEVFEGLAIYQALIDHDADVIVTIGSLAASIASVIAQAGDEVRIAENAQMMIHDAMAMCYGQAADMRTTADLLDRASENMAQLYATRSGVGTPKSWRQAMTTNGMAGTWYTAAEAVAAGLADTVIKNGARGEDAEDPRAVWQRSMVAHLIGAAGTPTAQDPTDNDDDDEEDEVDPDLEPTDDDDEDKAEEEGVDALATFDLDDVDLGGLAAALADALTDDTPPGYDGNAIAAALAEALGTSPAPTTPIRRPTDGPILPSSRRTTPTPDPDPDPAPARRVHWDPDELAAALDGWTAPAPTSTTAPPTTPDADDATLGAAFVRALQEAMQ